METTPPPKRDDDDDELPPQIAKWKREAGPAPPLLPLRISAGWLIRYNELRQIDPDAISTDDPRWVYMNQDLMQVEADDDERMLIDVGWYPDNDPLGTFAIKCVVETDWARPVATYQVRTLRDLADRLESLFARPPKVPVTRLLARLSGGTSDRRCAAAEALAEAGAIEAIDAISAAMREECIAPAYDRLGAARGVLVGIKVRGEMDKDRPPR